MRVSSSVSSQGCGVVEYGNKRDAQKALAELHDSDLLGRPLMVREDREEGGDGGGAVRERTSQRMRDQGDRPPREDRGSREDRGGKGRGAGRGGRTVRPAKEVSGLPPEFGFLLPQSFNVSINFNGPIPRYLSNLFYNIFLASFSLYF
jgi:RNA recognition motif-containing protein